ncbi:MAG TPA: hypothetical protein VHK88_04500, partial [Aquihabitans sp.]|nr:hypothetical protein [Aquihabitans sp.]
LVSTNAASAVAGANCDVTWSGEAIGHWSRTCLERVWLGRIPPDQRSVIYAHERLPRQQERIPLQLGPNLEAQLQSEQRHAAFFEIRRHPLQVAGAVPFRLARGLGLWWSPDQTRLEVAEGRIVGWEVTGRWFHLVVVLPAFALAVVATLRRRGRLATLLAGVADRRRLVPLGVAVALWLAGVAATHGSTRHRAAVDAVFLVGAAVGAALLLARRESRHPVRAAAPD